MTLLYSIRTDLFNKDDTKAKKRYQAKSNSEGHGKIIGISLKDYIRNNEIRLITKLTDITEKI